MKTFVLFLLGTFSGIILVAGVQLLFVFNPQLGGSRVPVEGPAGGGYYRGAIPDFSIEPVSGNIFEHIDPEWSLIARNKEVIPFSSFQGKVLFINLWATWCGPCIEEMPEIASLETTLNPDDIEVLLISNEQEQIVDAFENKHNLPLYVGRGKIPIVFKGKGLPSTFIVDKKGIIRYKHAGPAEWGHPSVTNYLSVLSMEN